MGFFGWFKELFSKTIKDKSDDKLLVSLPVKNSDIKIGRELEVKPNHSCVIVVKNKICDVFAEGRYRIEPKSIPLASRVAKLTKPNKRGDLPTKFKADIYFVNLNLLTANFCGTNFVLAKNQLGEKAKAKLAGTFDFCIASPVDFFEAMMTQYGIINNNIAIAEIGEWVANLVTRAVQKNRPTPSKLFVGDQSCFEGVTEYVNKELFDCGIKVENLKVESITFSKKQAKMLAELCAQNQGAQDAPKESQSKMQDDDSVQTEQISATQISAKANELNKTNDDKTIELGKTTLAQAKSETGQIDFSMSQQQSEILVQNKEKLENQSNEQNGNQILGNATGIKFGNESKMACNAKDGQILAESQNESVNAGLDQSILQQSQIEGEPIQKTITFKKCSNCGALNSQDSQICFSCGAKFCGAKSKNV